MRRTLLIAAAVTAAAFFAPAAAQAQFRIGAPAPAPAAGFSVGFGYVSPGYTYPPVYAGYPSFGHYDVVPAHVNRFGYVPPHVDYHYRGRAYAVDPFTGGTSPFPHRPHHGSHGHGHGHHHHR